MTTAHLSHEKLYAYDDGVLLPVERRAVERHLAACALCRARLAYSAAVVRTLKRQLGSDRAPRSLRTAMRMPIGEHDARRVSESLPPVRVLALVSIFGVLLLAAVLAVASRPSSAPLLVAQLVEGHRQLARETERVQVQGDAAALGTWLEAQLHEPTALPTPDGFNILGGRMENIDGQMVAHMLYSQANAAAMSLFVWRGAVSTANMESRELDEGRFYVGSEGAETVVLWRDHDLNYACVGEAAPDAMLDLARHVWRSDVN